MNNDYCGNDDIPAAHLTLRIPTEDDYRAYSVRDDGFSIFMGYSREWHWSMHRSEARRVAWFILWRWFVVGEWCGLRRWLYYRALRSYVDTLWEVQP